MREFTHGAMVTPREFWELVMELAELRAGCTRTHCRRAITAHIRKPQARAAG